MNAISPHAPTAADVRHDWTAAEIGALLDAPFPELMFRAASVHRAHHDPAAVQVATLLSIKTGGCPEDCAYCPQSAAHDSGVAASRLLDLEAVRDAARAARDAGATRFCMGAAWRSPKDRDLDAVCAMIEAVRAEGLQTCVTLGMLTAAQAARLREAGLDYYNHNLDTSEAFYARIISTRTYADRLETLGHVREAGISVCCGGIVGMGEGAADRAAMIATLASLRPHPESVPINALVRVAGTKLAHAPPVDGIDFVRTVAAARIAMPRSVVRLSAGRETMTDELQALCLLAGASSIFGGPRLLTTPNPAAARDASLLARLGMRATA